MLLNFYRMGYMDSSYKHSPIFKNVENQAVYFNTRVLATINDCAYEKGGGSITVPLSKANLMQYDYLSYINKLDDKVYYAFILGTDYVADNLTTVFYEIDVIQTYMFDYDLRSCFVDRMHVHRWTKEGKPIINTVPEGLEYGDLVQTSSVKLKQDSNGSYVIVSSSPLGRINNWQPSNASGGVDGKPNTPNHSENNDFWDYKNLKISKKGFRYVKGYEGYAPSPYGDSGGTGTVGYGLTKNGDATLYNQMVQNAPNDEKTSAINLKKVLDKFGTNYKNLIMKFPVHSQHQFDALLDLCFNGGPDALNSKHSLPTALLSDRASDESYVRPIWEKYWCSDGQNIQLGLQLRRKAECDMYFKGIYEHRTIPIINTKGVVSGNYQGNGYMFEDMDNNSGSDSNFPSKALFSNEFGSNWLYPTKGTVTAVFPAYSNGDYHNGTDIANIVGTDIYAVGDGEIVLRREWTDSYGLHLMIKHSEGVYSLYAHNSKLLKNVGDKVKKGDVIAKMGSTGNSTGSHCHISFLTGIYGQGGVYKEPIRNIKKGQVISW